MFSGIDLIVILAVVAVFLYATGSSKETEITLEPLALLVVIIVVGMVAVSVIGR